MVNEIEKYIPLLRWIAKELRKTHRSCACEFCDAIREAGFDDLILESW